MSDNEPNSLPQSNQPSLNCSNLLIDIHDSHQFPSTSNQNLEQSNEVHHNQGDPTLDLTINSTNDVGLAHAYTRQQSGGDVDPILPDVACVSHSHILSSSTHSYGSNQDGENQPLLRRFDADSTQIINNSFPDDPEYNTLIKEVEQAIENGHLPKRISQGSSGSYFVENSEGNVSFSVHLPSKSKIFVF